MGSFMGFMYRQIVFKPKPLSKGIRLDGQTIIITGANVGIGLEAAKEFAAHGASRIILGVRNITKGNEAKATIQREYSACLVDVWEVDQESWASMVAFGHRIRELERLDIAILNAGVKQIKFVKAATGHEQNVQVNHLGTALLSLFALEPLRRTAQKTGKPGRLTVTTSEMLWWTKFDESSAPNILDRLDEPDSMTGKDVRDRYSVSKWLTMAFARQLAAKVDQKEVVINGVNPGFCQSSLHRNDSGSAAIVGAVGWSSEQGGHCLTDAAVEHPTSHGGYISEQQEKPLSKFMLSEKGEQVQKKLWKETITLFQRDVPEAEIGDFRP